MVACGRQRGKRGRSLLEIRVVVLNIHGILLKYHERRLQRLFHTILEESGETSAQLVAERHARQTNVGISGIR